MFEPGDIVICVDCTFLADHLTQGWEYRVVRSEKPYVGQERVVIEKDDNGYEYICFADRFVKKEE